MIQVLVIGNGDFILEYLAGTDLFTQIIQADRLGIIPQEG